jgi:serine O-acetyltransferase
VLYQNSTVGKNHGEAPVLGDGVVLYPNTAIIGRCEIGAGTVVSQGTSIVKPEHAGNCMVFAGEAGRLCSRRRLGMCSETCSAESGIWRIGPAGG